MFTICPIYYSSQNLGPFSIKNKIHNSIHFNRKIINIKWQYIRSTSEIKPNNLKIQKVYNIIWCTYTQCDMTHTYKNIKCIQNCEKIFVSLSLIEFINIFVLKKFNRQIITLMGLLLIAARAGVMGRDNTLPSQIFSKLRYT